MATYYDPNDPYNQTPWADPYAQEAQPEDPNNPYPGLPPTPTPTPTPTPEPPPPPATANPWHTAPADGNWQAWFTKNLGRGTLTPAELKALAPELAKAGVQVLTNAKGISAKIQLPGGQIVDVIQGADTGGNTFAWQTGSGTDASGVDTTQMSIDPSYLAPWTGSAPSRPDIGLYVGPDAFRAPEGVSPVPKPYTGIGDFTETFSADPYVSRGEFGEKFTPDPYVGRGDFGETFTADPYVSRGDFSEKFTPDPFVGPGDFQAPTGDALLQDPSYLWRMEQGRGAIENSAAAKGLLNSGGTLSDILNYGQKAASQEYGNVWDRAYNAWNAKWGNALNEYSTNLNAKSGAYDRNLAAWNANANDDLNEYNTNLNAKSGAFDRNLNAWNANAGNQRADYATNVDAQGGAYDRNLAAWNANVGNDLNTYNTNLNAKGGAFDRNLSAWNTRAGNQRADYATNVDAQGGAYDRALNTWNAQAANAQNSFNTNLGAQDSAYNKAWQSYVDSKDTWYRNQNEPWSKLYQAASLGASASV